MKLLNLSFALASLTFVHTLAHAESSVAIGGLIEVEAISAENTSDIAVATVEVALAAELTEKVTGEIVLLHEEDATDFSVDTAVVGLAVNEHLSVTAGQTYVPFGVFGTYMISDPLTLELAETNATALQLDLAAGPATFSLYSFNGINAEDKVDNWGANLDFTSDHFLLTLGYIANIGDTGIIAADTINTRVPGMSVSTGVNVGGFSLIGEHISALDDFQVGDGNTDPVDGYLFTQKAKPKASNLEMAYIMDRVILAVATQRTEQAEDLGLPEQRNLASVWYKLEEDATVSLEFAQEESYAGIRSDAVTAQLAVAF